MTPWSAAVQAAAQRIQPHIRRTPLEYSPGLSQETGAQVYLKLEQWQYTGSFKLRGAANTLLQLAEAGHERVITASTGNHAAAVLHMADKLAIQVDIYLPETAAPLKIQRLQAAGAALTLVGQDPLESEQAARRAAGEQGIPFVSPYNDPDIIAGQGTLGLEIRAELPQADAILVPLGGGGLISGVGAALSTAHPRPQLIACSPGNSAVMQASVEAGRILDLPSLPTLSDGTAGGLEPDSITFPLCQQWVDHFYQVSEAELRQALYDLITSERYLVEGAAGLSLATLRQQQAQFQGKTVVLVLCGRNIGANTLRNILATDPADQSV